MVLPRDAQSYITAQQTTRIIQDPKPPQTLQAHHLHQSANFTWAVHLSYLTLTPATMRVY